MSNRVIDDRRKGYIDFDLKTIASLCTIFVFLGGIIVAIARTSEADTNSGQDYKIGQLETRTNHIEDAIAEQRQDIKDNNAQMNAKVDALLNVMGINPAAVLAKSKKQQQ